MAKGSFWDNYGGYLGAAVFGVAIVPVMAAVAVEQGYEPPYIIGEDPVMSYSVYGNAALAVTSFAAKRGNAARGFALASAVSLLHALS